MKIHKVERPREKLEKLGVAALRNDELLALLLGTGTAGKDVSLLSKELLKNFNDQKLLNVSLEQLKQKKGIGPAKGSVLLAAFELSKRLINSDGQSEPSLQSPKDVLAQVQEIRSRKKENFVVLYLNARNQLIHKEFVSIGSLNSAIVHPREVFLPAVQHSAASVVLSHNHPSGDCQPSSEDLDLTRRLISAGEILGIEVLDHLIVSGSGYLSMKEQSLM